MIKPIRKRFRWQVNVRTTTGKIVKHFKTYGKAWSYYEMMQANNFPVSIVDKRTADFGSH